MNDVAVKLIEEIKVRFPLAACFSNEKKKSLHTNKSLLTLT